MENWKNAREILRGNVSFFKWFLSSYKFFKETLVTASKISLRDAGIFLTLSCDIKIKNWYFWFWNLVGPLMRLFSTDFRDLLVCVAGLYRNNGPVFRSLFFIFHFSFKNCYIGYTIVWTFLDFSFYQSDVKLKIRLVSYFILLFFFFFLTLMSGIIFEIKCITIEVNFFFFNFEFVISSGKKYRENFEKKWIFWTLEIYQLYIYIFLFLWIFFIPAKFSPRIRVSFGNSIAMEKLISQRWEFSTAWINNCAVNKICFDMLIKRNRVKCFSFTSNINNSACSLFANVHAV